MITQEGTGSNTLI